jgi:hypothetical protein
MGFNLIVSSARTRSLCIAVFWSTRAADVAHGMLSKRQMFVRVPVVAILGGGSI